ncbi:MAG TPA: MFS transporter [Micromonosporaceae bacterium]
MPGFLINRDFARLWFGQAVSTVGDYVFDTTLTVWVATVLYRNDPRLGPLAIGGLVLAVILATVVVGPAAGVFVDRWSHRRIMLNSELGRFILVAGMTAVMFLKASAMPRWAWLVLVFGVVFLLNATSQFFQPSRFATIGDVVPGEADQARAFGLGASTSAFAGIIGPPLAAPLLFTVGVQWALLLNALSYLVSFLAIRSIRFPASAEKPATGAEPDRAASWWQEFRAGLRMFAGNRFLVALTLIAILAQFGTGPLNTLEIYFLRENLHSNQNLLGFLATAAGVGSVIGGLIAGVAVRRLNARNTTWVGIVLGGLLIVLLARQTNFYAGLAVLFLMFIPITAMNTALQPQLLAATPKEYLGRMMAVFAPVAQLSTTLSIAASSILASTVLLHFHADVAGLHMGRVDTLYSAGGIIIVISGVYAYFRLPPSSADEETAAVQVPMQDRVDLATPAATAAVEAEFEITP